MARDRSASDDGVPVASILRPGEEVIHVAPATPAMVSGGFAAWLFAAPAFAIGYFPLRLAVRHWHEAGPGLQDRATLILFGGWGVLWLLLTLIILYQPVRLWRTWPHVYHLLTDRRFVEVDRRTGITGQIVLADIWTFYVAPVARLRFDRRGYTFNDAARRPYFDGVRDVHAVAQLIADRTGVPVGITRKVVAASVARMPPGTKPR